MPRHPVGHPVVPHLLVHRLAHRLLHRLALRLPPPLRRLHRAYQGRVRSHLESGPTSAHLYREHDRHETSLRMNELEYL